MGRGKVSNDYDQVRFLRVKPHIAIAVEACRYECSVHARRMGSSGRDVCVAMAVRGWLGNWVFLITYFIYLQKTRSFRFPARLQGKHRTLRPDAMDVATLKVVVVGNNCSGEYHLHVSYLTRSLGSTLLVVSRATDYLRPARPSQA